jgi:thiamine transport system substrate-binding protein
MTFPAVKSVKKKESAMKGCHMFYVLAVFLGSLCPAGAKEPSPVVTLMTHDSFAVSEALLKRFEEKNGAKLKILKSGDAGAVLTQAILSKTNPLADVFFGVDNTFMSRALESGIFEPYPSPLLGRIPQHLKLDPKNRLLPVDYGDICLNYDKNWFAEKGLRPPEGLEDLIKPEYKGLTVVPNPATSSPGLGFMFATIGRFGEEGYLNFWKLLRANDVYVTAGWSDAYYGHFSRARGGTRPIVISYASSPPAEVYYSEKKLNAAPTAAVVSPGAAFRQIEFVGVLKGSRQTHLAHRLVDFILGPDFQKEIPLYMWVFPADPQTPLPEIFLKFAKQAEAPVMLNPAAIEKNRERWIESWTEVVLR